MPLSDRIKTLEEISGFMVRVYQRHGVNYFVFSTLENYNIKTICTYPKAKLFAEGIRIGQTL